MDLHRPCPDEARLQAFVENTLAANDSQSVLHHLDGCSGCRMVLSSWAMDHRSAPANAPLVDLGTDDLAPGTQLGRFKVLERLGAGAMGVVYAAYDPRLDRKVALKLLRPASSQTPVQLLREAQALARVSHPHVLGVFDAAVHEHDVYLALEHVEGLTVRDWLRLPRTRPEVLRVFRQAAEGVAAAHDAGIVHGDLKPENLLLGDDGRVRITDFGLGATGAVLGTPAYMSPEQRAHGEVDHRTDQFSLCVSLHEALTGHRPVNGVPSPRLPRPLQLVLARGLAHEPWARFESMHTLLDALRALTPTFPRRKVLTAAALALVAGVVVGGVLMHRRTSRVCEGASAEIQGVWNDAVRAEGQRAFEATKAPYAAEAWAGFARTIDGYATEWVKRSDGACSATRVTKERSEPLLTASTACLQRRLGDLKATLAVFTKADAAMVAKAATVTLPPLEPCLNVGWLEAQVKPPLEAGLQAQVAEARATLAKANALRTAGRFAEALQTLEPVGTSAAAQAYAPLLAEQRLALGETHGGAAKWAEALPALTDAVALAEREGHHEVSAQAMSRLIGVSHAAQRSDEAHLWARLAEAELTRLGHPAYEFTLHHNVGVMRFGEGKLDEMLEANARALAFAPLQPNPELARANILMNSGAAHDQRNQLELAQAELEESVALYERTLGPHHVRLAGALMNLAGVLRKTGGSHRTGPLLERALEILRATFGDAHPNVAITLVLDGRRLHEHGDLEAAKARYAEALAVSERVNGEGHPALALPMTGLGELATERGDLAEAKRWLELGLALAEKARGEKVPEVLMLHADHGLVLGLLGHHDAATAELERAISGGLETLGPDDTGVVADAKVAQAVLLARHGQLDAALKTLETVLAQRTRVLGPKSEQLVPVLVAQASTLLDANRLEEALAQVHAAQAIVDAAFGAESPRAATLLALDGRLALAQGQPSLALARLERADQLFTRAKVDSTERSEARLALAQAKLATGAGRDEVAPLVAEVQAAVKRGQPLSARSLAALGSPVLTAPRAAGPGSR